MASATQDPIFARLRWRGAATALLVALFLALVLLMLAGSLPGLGRHPTDRLWAYWLHILGGTLVMVLGPFQFIAPIRSRFRRYHRWAGYAFAGGSLATFIGFWAIQPTREDVFFASQATAICLWMLALGAAILAARRKRFLTHRHNMVRAFVLAAYFVIVRLIDMYGMGTLGPLLSKTKEVQLAHSDWLAWIIPLLGVEIYYGIQWNRLLKRCA